MVRRSMTGCLFVVGIVACYTAPAPRPPTPQVVTVTAPFETVWTAVLTIFTDANIPIENMEKASGFIRSGEMAASSGTEIGTLKIGDIVDCGREMGFARTATGTTFIAFTVLLQQTEGGTAIRLQSSARNTDPTTFSAPPNVQCSSTGAFEKLMTHRIVTLASGSGGAVPVSGAAAPVVPAAVPRDTVVVTIPDARVHEAPSPEARVLYVMDLGARLTLLEDHGDWWKVIVGTTTVEAYIRKSDVRRKSETHGLSPDAAARKDTGGRAGARTASAPARERRGELVKLADQFEREG